jgi:hypothetical protein
VAYALPSLIALMVLAAPGASGQTGMPPAGMPAPGAPPGTLQAPSPGRPPGATPAAPADTVVAVIAGPEGGTAPEAVHLVPGQTLLGEAVAIVLDFPAGAAPPADSLRIDAAWLHPAAAPGLAASDLPAHEGARLVLGARVYRLGPWRAAWQEGPDSAVQEVVGRLDGQVAAAPVRDPRSLGGLPRWLPWLLAAVVLALASWALLRRRRRADDRRDLPPPPPPAWFAAAVGLRDLDRDGQRGREFLDALAAIVRRFLEGRYGLPATGMSAADLAAVARDAAWPAGPLEGFAALLERCDGARYAPTVVDAVACREALVAAVALVDPVREQATWGAAAAADETEALAAWQELTERHREALAPGMEGAPC